MASSGYLCPRCMRAAKRPWREVNGRRYHRECSALPEDSPRGTVTRANRLLGRLEAAYEREADRLRAWYSKAEHHAWEARCDALSDRVCRVHRFMGWRRPGVPLAWGKRA